MTKVGNFPDINNGTDKKKRWNAFALQTRAEQRPCPHYRHVCRILFKKLAILGQSNLHKSLWRKSISEDELYECLEYKFGMLWLSKATYSQ
ncbi:unnamed protein product [Cercopithifilaria johnstoni]|uniref:Uncharacterized protein n=1 Tax=Cercopithifilaria johnstoni TaxID=2874296 RepID=A0A8J2Q3I7_9BILA|nr:unnamed protein product [Cercopithifilaria johnstoni]